MYSFVQMFKNRFVVYYLYQVLEQPKDFKTF